MTTPILIRAAELLEVGAEELKRSNTYSGGEWPDLDESDLRAHADHDEMLATAAGLRVMHKMSTVRAWPEP